MGPGSSFHRVLVRDAAVRGATGRSSGSSCARGKVFYDLQQAREERGLDGKVALVRLEELAPFPEEALDRASCGATRRRPSYVWCQEEPRNMGAWFFVAPRTENLMETRRDRAAAARLRRAPASASPATGHHAQHEREQHQLVEDAFTV